MSEGTETSDPQTSPGIPYRIGRVLVKSPATFLMLAILMIVALLTGTNLIRLPREVLEAVGFPPRTLGFDQAYRVVTSALVTIGPRVFFGAMIMVALAMGAAERAYGSVRALLIFWGVHTFTFASTTLLGIAIGGVESMAPLAQILSLPDVGPSAGYMGCLGAAFAWYRGWPGRVLSGLVILWLVVDLAGPGSIGPALSQETAADLAHLIALPAGWFLGRFWSRADPNAPACNRAKIPEL